MSLLRTLHSIPDIKRNAKRFAEITTVLAKYGLASWMDATHPEFLKARLKTIGGVHIADLSPDARIRMALTELGTAFIKLGQVMSTRADLVGKELAEELTKLQADTPPQPIEVVRKTFEEELGRPIESCFASFSAEPRASASIGQVHEATLPDGRDVVVKIQHAGIQDVIEADLAIMDVLADVAEENDSELSNYHPVEVVREFKRQLIGELDYTRERLNLDRFAENFAEDETVRFPIPFPELSARRVLTMDDVEGVTVADEAALEAAGVDRKAFAEMGAHLWIEMILRDGFYHADPHPGNIVACPDGRVGVLDCGMVGRIDERTLEQFEELVLAILSKDGQELARTLLRICEAPIDLDRAAYTADVTAFCGEYLSRPVDDIDFTAVANESFEVIREHHVRLPSPITMLVKTIAVLEGTSRRLDREFNVIELLQPYQKRIVLKRLSPTYLFKRALKTGRDYERLFRALPQDVMDILERSRSGQINVQLEHRGLDAAANRLVYGMICSALLLGAAWLLAAQTPPRLFGLSLLGLFGGLVGGVMGFRLLWAMARRGKLGD